MSLQVSRTHQFVQKKKDSFSLDYLSQKSKYYPGKRKMQTPKDFKSMVHFPVEETNPADLSFLPTPELIKKGMTPEALPVGSSGLGTTPNATINLYTPQTPKERVLGRNMKPPKTGFEKPPTGTVPFNSQLQTPARYQPIKQTYQQAQVPKPTLLPVKQEKPIKAKNPAINRITKNSGFTATSPATSSSHHYGDVQCLTILEGLNKTPTERYPGGRTNTKNAMPKQVVMVEKEKLPQGVRDEDLLVQAEVLGFSRAVQDMVPIGILEPLKNLQKDENDQLVAIYQNSILRFSSHSHGQKLALRWTLFCNKHRICSLDSYPFQTITERGIQKQQKRRGLKDGSPEKKPKSTFKGLQKKRKPPKKKWTFSEVRLLIDGLEKHGEKYELILKEGKPVFDSSRTHEDLQNKHKMILQG